MKNFEPKVEMWDIARIRPYEKNAKKHPPEQIAKLAVAFDTFGFDVPLVVDSTGSLLKGHGRYLALKSQNRKQVPVIVRNDLTPDEIKAARLADNKLAESAWDNDFLSSEMIELYDAEFPIDILGFSAAETAQLFGIELDDPSKEWDGMPEYEHEDQTSARKIVVHFKTMDDFHDFAKAIGQDIPEKIKSIWYPQAEVGRYADKRYAIEENEVD